MKTMDRKVSKSKEPLEARKKESLVKGASRSVEAVQESFRSRAGVIPPQEKIEDSKFFMGQGAWHQPASPRELPRVYHENRIVLLVVDPWWAHTYWEVTQEKILEGLRFLECSLDKTKSVLRVYDVTGSEGGSSHQNFFDIELTGMVQSWYLSLNRPDRSFRVDIGLLGPDGRFFTLARSNTVTMPRFSVSDVVDERWMTQDFDRLYALSGGLNMGASSLDFREGLEKRLRESMSSGAVSSFGASPVKKLERKFWFVLDTELIVYGATEPDAQVTVCGQSVQLRPDGTFTLRFALPDGHFPIPAVARSSDGIEERTITPVVDRKTDYARPVIHS